jgi:hypothetical protein
VHRKEHEPKRVISSDLVDTDCRNARPHSVVLWRRVAAALALVVFVVAHADPAPFDLAGPTIEVAVTRAGTTLPAGRVPNLVAGDRVWMKADLDAGASAHYLMVATFLRGSTAPPPTSWFSPCETWARKCAAKGMTLTVPEGAQQLLVFLAPETGGDFSTLVNAVRGRPGVFVRAAHDLNQAGLDRSRLERYLEAIRRLGEGDPARLKEVAPLLSRSLGIKVDEKCLEKTPDMQAACLMQGRESLIMTDGHSTSVTQELTSGPASDLAMEASNAPQLKSGYYGPFIGSVLDIARLLDTFHTAQYQYIPALTSMQERRVALALNAPPSFHDPKSVLVVALPAVVGPQFPPLRPVDPKETYCARKNPLVLPVEGAPLVFATAYAHDLKLTVRGQGDTAVELPATADPERGAVAIDTSALRAVSLGNGILGTLHGDWGFDKYNGPSFQLVDAREQTWALTPGDEAALIVGRQDTVRLRAGNVSCIADLALTDAAGKQLSLEWKPARSDEVDLKLALQEEPPGELTLLIRQYGDGPPQRLSLHAYSEASHLDGFALHAGDTQGVLRGNRLDEVERLVLKDVEFVPGALSTSQGHDELSMLTSAAQGASGLKAGDTAMARVTLKDGRAYDVKASVDTPRPSAILIGKSAQVSPSEAAGNIRLSNEDELPQDAQLTFSLRAQSPPSFSHDEKIEVTTIDGSSSTVLDVSGGAMTLENAKVAVATLSPGKALGSSAFGPLRFRMVSNGVVGDWRSLATLVRLPVLKKLECPGSSGTACKLSGVNLFLLDSVSGDSRFSQPITVPEGFTGQALLVPRPAEGQLYVKLRDDPSVISVATLDAQASAPATAPGAAPPADATRNQADVVERSPAPSSSAAQAQQPGPGAPARPVN